jgi:hypothetical protein
LETMATDSGSSSGHGRVVFCDDPVINGVKIFSATMMAERGQLGNKVTDWLSDNPACEVREIFVTQSSDEAFHCIAITLFYWEEI